MDALDASTKLVLDSTSKITNLEIDKEAISKQRSKFGELAKGYHEYVDELADVLNLLADNTRERNKEMFEQIQAN